MEKDFLTIQLFKLQEVQDDSELEDYSAQEVGHLVLPERVPIQVGVPQGDAPGAQVRQQENLHHNLNHNLASGKKYFLEKN